MNVEEILGEGLKKHNEEDIVEINSTVKKNRTNYVRRFLKCWK